MEFYLVTPLSRMSGNVFLVHAKYEKSVIFTVLCLSHFIQLICLPLNLHSINQNCNEEFVFSSVSAPIQ